jgi:hypothetical protein
LPVYLLSAVEASLAGLALRSPRQPAAGEWKKDGGCCFAMACLLACLLCCVYVDLRLSTQQTLGCLFAGVSRLPAADWRKRLHYGQPTFSGLKRLNNNDGHVNNWRPRDSSRATGCAFKKVAQNVAQPIFCPSCAFFTLEDSSPIIVASFSIFRKLPKVNDRPIRRTFAQSGHPGLELKASEMASQPRCLPHTHSGHAPSRASSFRSFFSEPKAAPKVGS